VTRQGTIGAAFQTGKAATERDPDSQMAKKNR
jgi:hypothetical protein